MPRYRVAIRAAAALREGSARSVAMPGTPGSGARSALEQAVASKVTVEEITESQTRRVVFGDFAYAYADYLKETGEHCPDMTGPNRPAARLADRVQVEKFHRELQRKLDLQRSRRYRLLWWRKATLEFPRLVSRYVRWFLVRILRIKSILGTRKEVSRSKISIFR